MQRWVSFAGKNPSCKLLNRVKRYPKRRPRIKEGICVENHHNSYNIKYHATSFGTSRHVLQNLVAVFFLEFLGFHAQGIAIGANFVLQAGNDTNGEFFLLAAKTISGANHFRAFQGLSMPVVTIKATFQVGITLCLKEIVVMSLLIQVVQIIVVAVVANLLYHSADGRLVFTDQLGILDLFDFQDFYQAPLLGEGTLKFSNTGT